MDGITKAIGHMRERNFEAKGKQVTRVIRILEEGLRASLDPRGGEVSNNLRDLYDYMAMRLLQGSVKNDPAILVEVRNLLQDVKGAWEELARTTHANAVQAHAAAARLAA
jgi:flagellar protein FliS